MKTWLQQVGDNLTTSFWFVPSMMAVGSSLLAISLLLVDELLAAEGKLLPGWLRVGNIDGLRTLLSSLLGSIITVLGVLFSITIVALTLAASQLGPRLLRNFIRDRINQTVLGIFVATYVYCLMVLFAVGRLSPADASLPQVSTLGAFLLGMASLAALIYFIHHLAVSIQAPHVLMVVAHELRETIDRHLPQALDEPQQAPDHAQADDGSLAAEQLAEDEGVWRQALQIRAKVTGYVQAIDIENLVEFAVRHDLQFRLCCRPGDFVARGASLVLAIPPQQDSDRIIRSVLHDIYIGSQRTATQDLEFMMQELVEVALRAISPSINDPFTAINAVDYLGESLTVIAGRRMPPRALRGEEGRIRLLLDRTDFRGLCDVAFNQIRQHSQRYPSVLIRMLERLTSVARHTRPPQRRKVLWHHGRMIERMGAGFSEEYDRKCLRDRFLTLHEALLPESSEPDDPTAA